MAQRDVVQFVYRNHRGEVAIRTVRPIRVWFGSTAWHPEAQWLLEVFDLDKQQTRDYAMAGVLSPWFVYDELGLGDGAPQKWVKKWEAEGGGQSG